ncbi:DUF4097 family beta strand repeat-containing protein [Streptomyces sp. ACA25]|uniref:DUF4097 family beta strand repeat-containing protein n=1 Tax=Streptomyces sp. ACA25 TaxID=3022596 RepID=UPI002307C702|nr:DUF4097 family beta strand repeat-containing protein [Streptomyces sp. ACA25]MDB1087765.1 DUF4097 family beta strand repeat-containing protein [Streptomyces sp. ACA25]
MAKRTAPSVLLLAGAVLLATGAVSACGVQETHDISGEQRAFPLAAGELVIDSGNSRIDLIPDDGLDGEVGVTRWFQARKLTGDTGISWSMEGNTLSLHTTCRGMIARCEARHEVRVPADVEVRAEARNGQLNASGFTAGLDLTTRNGPIDVAGSSGPLTLSSRNGSIEVAGTEGPVSLSSRNGGITATGMGSDRVSADSRNGRIRMTMDRAPSLVETDSRNGRTTIELPDGSYRVSTRTDNGKVEVSVPQDEGSAHRISTRSRNGDITVRSSG